MGDRTDVGGGGIATFVPPDVTLVEHPRLHGRPCTTSWPAFATASRLNTLGMIQLAGSGHIGSSFSSLDVLSWLLARRSRRRRVLLLEGPRRPRAVCDADRPRRLPFDLVTGCAGSVDCPGILTSSTPGIVFNTGSLGMGISKAKGLVARGPARGSQPAASSS
jgi:transketolase